MADKKMVIGRNNDVEIPIPVETEIPTKDSLAPIKDRGEVYKIIESTDFEIILGGGGCIVGNLALLIFAVGVFTQLIGWDFSGLFNLIMTAIVIGGGFAPAVTASHLINRRIHKLLAEPINKVELALAKKIGTHNRRLEAYRTVSFTGEEKLLIEGQLSAEQKCIKYQIALLERAKLAKTALDELRNRDLSLPMTDEIDILLAAGTKVRIDELTEVVESINFLDEMDVPPQLTE